MSGAAELVQRLFGAPGDLDTSCRELARQAAWAHEALLTRACAMHAGVMHAGAVHAGAAADRALQRSLGILLSFLQRPAPARLKRALLCHPLFVDGLHGLSPLCPEIRRWHERVLGLPATPASEPISPAAHAQLGNIALALLLRADSHWHGTIDLCTDCFGRLGFPFCDWNIALSTAAQEVLAGRVVRLSLERGQVSWRLADGATPDGEVPAFLEMNRGDFLRMLLDNDGSLEVGRLRFPHPGVHVRLQCARRLGRSPIRYDPVGFVDFAAHAGLTGGIVRRVLAAIRRRSPVIYGELCAFMHTIRGFELPASPLGVLESFSEPTHPGVMGINVPYSPAHEPRLNPFCFTWFGHELGHTKDYLIDNFLYCEGATLLHNAADSSGVIPRYGRALSLRTLIQVPYVHLYEWALFMDFLEAGFRGLPWDCDGDAVALGADIAAEIEESFELLRARARLTPVGEAALTHFQRLFDRARGRWQAALAHHSRVRAS